MPVPVTRVQVYRIGAAADAPPIWQTDRPTLAVRWLDAAGSTPRGELVTLAYVGEDFSPALTDAIGLGDVDGIGDAIAAELLDQQRQEIDKPVRGDVEGMARAHRAGDPHPGADCDRCLADSSRRAREARN